MIESVQGVAYGEAANVRSVPRSSRRKAGDPLAPVTVIVPSNFAGLSLRRMLAGADADDGRVGIANVDFVTPYRLAELLGRSELAQQSTAPAHHAGAHRRDPGRAPAASRASSARSRVITPPNRRSSRCYAELSRARPETVSRLETEGSPRARAVVELFARVRKGLAEYADEDALARAALGALQGDRAEVAALGTVILFLPEPRSPALTDLLAALVQRVPTRAVVGLTGVTNADREVVRFCARLGIELGAERSHAAGRHRDRDRLRCRRRGACGRPAGHGGRGGGGPSRSDRDPLSRTRAVRRARCTSSSTPRAFPTTVRVWAGSMPRVTGRALLRLLALADGDLRRGDVMALVNAAPVRDGAGRLVPAARWDLVSRRAGVVGGAADWDTKLRALAEEQAARAEKLEADGESEGMVDSARGEAEHAEALRAFIARLVRVLEQPERSPSWGAPRAVGDVVWCARCSGTSTNGAAGPSWSSRPRGRIDAALTRLAALDSIEPTPSEEVFARAIAVELEASLGRSGRFGEGVVCGPLALGLGLDLDAVFVLGLAEGTCPAPRRDDALIADADRGLAVDGELPLRSERVHEQHRAFLAAIASGAHTRVLVVPRGDHRSGRSRLPSRWALDTAAALSGQDRVLQQRLRGARRSLDRFGALVRRRPPRRAPRRRRSPTAMSPRCCGTPRRAFDPDAHPVAYRGALARGLELARARASEAFTRFDGNLAGYPVPSPALGEVLSATRLETWASCPLRYFLGSVLRLGVVEAPEEIVEISAMDRGSLMHEVLEAFLEPVVAKDPADRIQPGEVWSPEDHAPAPRDRRRQVPGVRGARSHGPAVALGDRARRRSWRTSSTSSWWTTSTGPRRSRCRIRWRCRSASRIAPRCGSSCPTDASSSSAAWPTGSIGRSTARSTVIDYKTGKGREEERALATDPVVRGRRLQLPLYAEAARQQLGATDARAFYWFATARGEFKRFGYELDDSRRERFEQVLAEIVDGIEGGVFPAAPGQADTFFGSFTNCGYCDFDSLCSSDRDVHADAKKAAPELVRFRRLADGEDGWSAPPDEASA